MLCESYDRVKLHRQRKATGWVKQDPEYSGKMWDIIKKYKPAEISVRAWAKSRPATVYNDPEGVLRSWVEGKGDPPRTKILAASQLIGCTEAEVAMACYGVGSQAEAIAAHQEAVRAKNNEERRNKWETDTEYKEIKLNRNRGSRIKKRLDKMEKIKSGEISLSNKAKSRLGLLTEQDKIELKREQKKRGYIAFNKKSGRVIKYNGKHYSISGIRHILSQMRSSCDRIEKEMETCCAHFKQWHFDGYKNIQSAYRAGHELAVSTMKEKWKNLRHQRRAKEKGSGGAISAGQWRELMKRYDYKCAYCGVERKMIRDPSRKMDLEMDHVVPLGQGRHTIENIVPACKSCNTSKSNNDLIEWANKKRISISDAVMQVYTANKYNAHDVQKIDSVEECNGSPPSRGS